MTFADFSFYLFTGLNGIRITSYLPQMIAVARDRNGASAISYATWAMWVTANGSTGLYALVNLHDPVMAAINVMNAGCCLVVIALTASKRRRSRFDAHPFGVMRPIARNSGHSELTFTPQKSHKFADINGANLPIVLPMPNLDATCRTAPETALPQNRMATAVA
ncbi:hypothetical protein [Mesorhizobium sp. BH1-1-4]|uniref:hypothetical protein n=1 Tax=Mesorhizobium sp. BH1-1-4 TaxID=2876662 RepID=UPI001CD163B5|nr:hypothetical protein [Mesorhizobium sp. BH1-1-4]MBZ9994219.1 hypothetical protein [Mesorhizobium sp. BH1-1-4]